MAIRSNFEYRGSKYDSVVFKIVRVFGSKREGWNAVFAFVLPDEEFVELNFRGLITVGAAWSEESPYPVLYKQMEDILAKGGFTFANDLELPNVEEVAVEPTKEEITLEDLKGVQALEPVMEAKLEVQEPTPKKTKRTKVTKDGKSTSRS